MTHYKQTERTTKVCRQPARLVLFGVLSLVTVLALSIPSSATGNIVKSDLAGTWQIALRGVTGCGFVSMQSTVALNTTGSGTASIQSHGQCGDSSLTGQSFTITSLSTSGSGIAGLSCGIGCGWTFTIQVSPDRSKFNLVDVSTTDPGNYLEGVAVLSSPNGNIAVSDLTGSWQMTLLGQGGCGVGSVVVTFTLNSSGVSNNATETAHNGCGDGTTSGNNFTVLSLNSDGSGTANLSCGSGCGFNFNIQVSPDRSKFIAVDVSSANPGNYLAGEATNNSTAAQIVNTNLAGKWQVAIFGEGGCGAGADLVTFTLNAKGATTSATTTSHSGCGDSTTSGNSFKVLSLNANGSGTANLSCGSGCGFNFNIQVSPDRSTFNLVDVSPANPANYLIGTAIHQ